MPADRTPSAATVYCYTTCPGPKGGGFLERNPHLIENYLALCAELGETPGEVPEEVGAIGRERPPDHVFEAMLADLNACAEVIGEGTVFGLTLSRNIAAYKRELG